MTDATRPLDENTPEEATAIPLPEYEGDRMTDQETPQSDPDGIDKDQWFEEDAEADAAEAGLTGNDQRRKKLLIVGAVLTVLVLAVITMIGVALNDVKKASTPLPSKLTVTTPVPDDAIPTRQLAGFDLSECPLDRITVREDGWVGFPADCVKLISSEEMPSDLP